MFRIILFAAALLASLSCTNAPTDPDAAVIIEDQTISYAQLELILGRQNGDSLMVEGALDNLINSRLVMYDARNRGFDRLPEIEMYAYEREREHLQNLWLSTILEEKVTLPPDTVREFYDQMGTMVIYTAMNVQDSLLCDSLRNLTLAGADLGDLVEAHSSIEYDRQIRGSIGPSDLMRVSDNDRELLTGLQEGDVSHMGLFSSGWRFLYVDSMYQVENEPFEEISEFIGQYILSHLREDYKQSLEDSMRVVRDLTIMEDIPSLVASHAVDDTGEYMPYSEEELTSSAYTFDGGSRSLHSLVENISNLPPMMPREPTNPEWVEGYCWMLGLYDIMALEGRILGYDTLPDIVATVEQRVNGRILDIYYEQVIGPRLIPTEEEIQEAYNENTSMLIIPEMRTFEAIGAVGEEELEVLTRTIEMGEEPFDQTDELTLLTDLTLPDEQVLTRMMSIDEFPSPWDSLLFSADIGEMVLCTLSTDRIVVFCPIESEPERAAELEEAREELQALISSEMEEEIVSALVDSLRSVYHYEVDRDFVNGFIIEGDGSVQEQVVETESVPSDSQSTE